MFERIGQRSLSLPPDGKRETRKNIYTNFTVPRKLHPLSIFLRKKNCSVATTVYPLFAMNHEHITKLKQTSTFWNALAVSGRGVRVLDCSFGARFKPNFSLWSKWLPLLWGKASAKYHTTNKSKDKKRRRVFEEF